MDSSVDHEANRKNLLKFMAATAVTYMPALGFGTAAYYGAMGIAPAIAGGALFAGIGTYLQAKVPAYERPGLPRGVPLKTGAAEGKENDMLQAPCISCGDHVEKLRAETPLAGGHRTR